jgi:hypothetical protein
VSAVSFNIQDKGLPESIDHISTMQRNFTAQPIGQIVDIALQQVQDEAQGNAPVFTGTLRGSIQHQMTGPTAGECFVGVDYAAAQEFGFIAKNGNRIPGKNYFSPAAIHGRLALIKMLQDFAKLNATHDGAKRAASSLQPPSGRKGAVSHKFLYKRLTGAGKPTYVYGKKSTTVTRRKALLRPGSGKQYRQTGKRRKPGRRAR